MTHLTLENAKHLAWLRKEKQEAEEALGNYQRLGVKDPDHEAWLTRRRDSAIHDYDNFSRQIGAGQKENQ